MPGSLSFNEFLSICVDSGLICRETASAMLNMARYQGDIEDISRVPAVIEDSHSRYTRILSTQPQDNWTFSEYIVSFSNEYAVELARTIAMIPKIWKTISPVLLHGNHGTGKSHILSAIKHSYPDDSRLIINVHDLLMEYNLAAASHREIELGQWTTKNNFLLLDGIENAQGNIDFQKFLCSLFDRMPLSSCGIVVTSSLPPKELCSLDNGLLSRITSGLVVELKPLDYQGRISLLHKYFSHAGYGPSEEIIDMLATQLSDNARIIKAAARAVTAGLLSSGKDLSVTRVSELLDALHFNCQTSTKNDLEKPEDTPPLPATQPADNNELRTLVSEASTIEGQILALRLAAGRRIEELKQRNASEAELKKLELTISYLNSGDIEKAMNALK